MEAGGPFECGSGDIASRPSARLFDSRRQNRLDSPSGNDFAVGLSFQSGNENFSLHAARAKSHPCGAGPGLANIKEIKPLRGGNL